MVVNFLINPKWRIFHSEDYKKTADLLHKRIYRDINHPSIIIWSMGINLTLHRISLRKLVKTCLILAKSWDPSRLLTYSSASLTYHPLREYVDIISIEVKIPHNFGLLKQFSTILEAVHYDSKMIPVLISKIGVPSKFKSKPVFMSDEKFQSYLLTYLLPLINNHSCISGYFLWQYKDFVWKTARKQKKIHINHQGIINLDNTLKLSYSIIPHYIKQLRKYSINPIFSRILRNSIKIQEFFAGKIGKFFTFQMI